MTFGLCGLFGHAYSKELIVLDVEPKGVSETNIHFLPGAFRLSNKTDAIEALCVFANHRWVSPNRFRTPCNVDALTGRPIPKSTFSMPSDTVSSARITVANLGIDDEQWQRRNSARALDPQGLSNLARIQNNIILSSTVSGFTWGLNSSGLPPELRNEIPGSGIFYHLGSSSPSLRRQPIFSSTKAKLIISTEAGFSRLKLDGGSTTTLTLALDFIGFDVMGQAVPMTQIVELFNSRGKDRDKISSDGRHEFVASVAGLDSNFLRLLSKPVEGIPQPQSLFELEVTAEMMDNMLAAFSQSRQAHDLPALDLDSTKVLLKRLSIRNESRFLDRGTLDLLLQIHFLRATASE